MTSKEATAPDQSGPEDRSRRRASGRSDEPLGEPGSIISGTIAFRHQISKYGYVRGSIRHAKRQAIRWRDIIGWSKQKGAEEYYARKSASSRSVQYFPGVGVLLRGGSVTGPKQFYVIGAIFQHYALILFRFLLFFLFFPLFGIIGVLMIIGGAFELKPLIIFVGLFTSAVCFGAVYWLNTADVASLPNS